MSVINCQWRPINSVQNTQVCLPSQAATRLQPDTPPDDFWLSEHNRTWPTLTAARQQISSIDWSFTCIHLIQCVHVIGSQNHPKVSWFLIGPCLSHGHCSHVHNTPKPRNIHRSDSGLSMIRRPGCLIPELAITNKKTPQKDDSYCYAPPWPTGISHSAAIG